jgi:hypothetical protein
LTTPGTKTRTIIASRFLLALACSSTPSLPPAPAVAAAPPPPPELSTIVVPIRASLAPLLPEIESRVPNKASDTTRERGIDIKYEVARDPLKLQMAGAGLLAKTKVRYAMEACRGKFPCISCGFKEARREADITLHTKLQWDASWRLHSTTTLLPVDYAKPCEVTWLNIDITRRFVAPVVEQQLNAAARIIDKNTPALATIRPRAEEVWTSLQTPVEIAPRTWLVLEPSDITLAPITGSGLTVTTTLGLRALTRIVVGAKPAVARKPLPPLRVENAAGSDMRVPFDLELPYDDATQYISGEVAGKTFVIEGKPLKIESIRLAPSANGKVLIEAMIDYRGGRLRNYKGLIFLEGTPRFDTATSMIVLPDLDYSLDPKRRGFLARIAERGAHDNIRTRLRNSARFPLADRLNAMREEITRALTRKLAPGVALRGRADTLQATSVTPLQHVLLIRMLAVGRAEVIVQ